MAIALGALNLTALGFPMTERIPISGAGDPGTTILALANKVRGVTVVPVEYGSATNQASVIQAAITAASDGDVLAFGAGVVKIETNVTCTKNISFIGNRTIFRTTSNITILTITTATDVRVDGIFFEGNNTGAAQNGLFMNTSGYNVSNCIFLNFNIVGMIAHGTTTTPYRKSTVSNCRAISCTGTGFSVTGEYVTLENCDAPGCGKGIVSSGGNITMIGCSGNASTTGIEFNSYANSGKTTVYGGHFNHCTNSIVVNSALNGIVFHGVEAVTGAMTINADNIHFIGCQLAGASSNMNSKVVLFMGNIINHATTFPLTNTSGCVFVNNYYLGTPASLWTGA